MVSLSAFATVVSGHLGLHGVVPYIDNNFLMKLLLLIVELTGIDEVKPGFSGIIMLVKARLLSATEGLQQQEKKTFSSSLLSLSLSIYFTLSLNPKYLEQCALCRH